MFKLLLLSEDAQIAIFLVVAENAINYFVDKKFYKSAKDALDKCWNYLEKKDVRGDDLYELIGSEDDNLVYLQVESESENDIKVWDCVIDSVLYTCRKAYDKYNEHLPQAVEIADFTLYDHLVSQYIMLNPNIKKTLSKIELFFSSNYIQGGEYKELNVSDLRRLIQS